MKFLYLFFLGVFFPFISNASTLALTKFVVESQYLQNGRILLSQASNTIKFDVEVTRGFVNGNLESPVSFSVKLIYSESGKSDVDLCAWQNITDADFNAGSFAAKTFSATISSDKTAGTVSLVYEYYDYPNSTTIGPIASNTTYSTYNPNGSSGTDVAIANNIIHLDNVHNNWVDFVLGDAGTITGGNQKSYTVTWQYSPSSTFPGTTTFTSGIMSGTGIHQFNNSGIYQFIYTPADDTFTEIANPHSKYITPSYPTVSPTPTGILYIRRKVVSGTQTSYSNSVQIATPTNTSASFTAYNITAAKKALDPNYHNPLGDNFIDIGIKSPTPGVTYLIYYGSITGTIPQPPFASIKQFSIMNSNSPTKAVTSSDLIYLSIDKSIVTSGAQYVFFVSSDGYRFHSALNTF